MRTELAVNHLSINNIVYNEIVLFNLISLRTWPRAHLSFMCMTSFFLSSVLRSGFSWRD